MLTISTRYFQIALIALAAIFLGGDDSDFHPTPNALPPTINFDVPSAHSRAWTSSVPCAANTLRMNVELTRYYRGLSQYATAVIVRFSSGKNFVVIAFYADHFEPPLSIAMDQYADGKLLQHHDYDSTVGSNGRFPVEITWSADGEVVFRTEHEHHTAHLEGRLDSIQINASSGAGELSDVQLGRIGTDVAGECNAAVTAQKAPLIGVQPAAPPSQATAGIDQIEFQPIKSQLPETIAFDVAGGRFRAWPSDVSCNASSFHMDVQFTQFYRTTKWVTSANVVLTSNKNTIMFGTKVQFPNEPFTFEMARYSDKTLVERARYRLFVSSERSFPVEIHWTAAGQVSAVVSDGTLRETHAMQLGGRVDGIRVAASSGAGVLNNVHLGTSGAADSGNACMSPRLP